MFDFDAVFDNDIDDVMNLMADPVQSLDGDIGRISHVLVGPTTGRAEWAVAYDADSGHHLIPVDLLERAGDGLVVHLPQEAVDSVLSIEDPEDLHERRLTAAVLDAMNLLEDDLAAQVDRSLLAGSGWYVVHSLDAVASTIDAVEVPEIVTPVPDRGGSGSGRGAGGGPAEVSPEASPEPVRNAPSPSVGRTMVADLPKTVRVDGRFSVEVQVKEHADPADVAGVLPTVVGGSTVVVNAIVPASFDVHGDLTYDISVPLSGDSAPQLFSFTPRQVGTFPLRLTAYVAGTYVGELQTEVSVAHETVGTSREATSTLSGAASRDGEVSLQITFDAASKTFGFLFIGGGEHRPAPGPPLVSELQARIESVIGELDSYARDRSGLSESDVQQRIRVRGFELWRDLVPEEIKSAIFSHLDDIAQLTIISDREAVPWELLYPQAANGDEPGFLVSLFPVHRWVMKKPWTQRISLRQPTFVVPEDSPPMAQDEAAAIRDSLKVSGAPTVTNRQDLLDRLASPSFDVLHFACHNAFAADVGSSIRFPDSAFSPSDLALHAAARPLADKKSLVFMNACRTQGTRPLYTTFENWAKSFLDLGAAAVIGTSWAVRDRAARPFAEAVYEGLSAGETLGESVAAARRQISTNLGDPTWLAYTVYGDPHAKVDNS